MGTPFIGQHDNAKMGMLIFLSWLNTFMLGIVLVFLAMSL
jgi:hypothetical protein